MAIPPRKYNEIVAAVANRIDNECWEWSYTILESGYGQVSYKSKNLRVHIIAYELRYGPIPMELELDHTCENKSCWNPEHLQPLTKSEHARITIERNPECWGGNRRKTHCPKGHPYSEENTYFYTYLHRGNMRICKACKGVGPLA